MKAGEQEPVGRGQGWIKEKGEEGSLQGREGSKQEGETRGEGEVTEGTGSGLHHPDTVDGENSCSLREFRSLEDSDEWHKEWQC